MRIAVLGDVHANLPALQAVLADLAGEPIDAHLCAGDLVGYGPMPDACVAALAALDPVAVAGNHDLIALGRLTTGRCSPLARATLDWTRATIGPRTRRLLKDLPATACACAGAVVVAHGSLDDPEEYVRTTAQAQAHLVRLAAAHPAAEILVLGHTHVPLAVSDRRGELLRGAAGTVRIEPGERLLLNAGSVGQSRDRRPRARYLVLDTDRREAQFRSIRFDTAAVRRALREAGLPEDAYHDRPHVSSPVGRAVVHRVPRPVRREIRRLRRWAVRG